MENKVSLQFGGVALICFFWFLYHRDENVREGYAVILDTENL